MWSDDEILFYYDLCIIKSDGSDIKCWNPESAHYRPSSYEWSPDGNHVAFSATRDQESGAWDIYLMNVDGSSVVLMNEVENPYFWGWSSFNGHILFSSRHGEDDGLALYVMKPDGSNVVRLTLFDLVTSWNWSPDGNRIAFSLRNEASGGDSDIYIAAVDGSDFARLISSYDHSNDSFGCWMPDGRNIVFSSDRDRKDGGFDIYMMDVDRSNLVRLTDGLGYVDNIRPICSRAGD